MFLIKNLLVQLLLNLFNIRNVCKYLLIVILIRVAKWAFPQEAKHRRFESSDRFSGCGYLIRLRGSRLHAWYTRGWTTPRTLPTDVTIRSSKSECVDVASRTSLQVADRTLRIVSSKCSSSLWGPIIPALLPRDGKRIGREGEKETGGGITAGGVWIHLIENLYILRIYQTIIR